jgi:hypothetical protein
MKYLYLLFAVPFELKKESSAGIYLDKINEAFILHHFKSIILLIV